MLLAALGGLLGLLLAQAETKVLLVFMRLQADPISFNVAPDVRVLLFTLALSLQTGLLFGLAPAFRASRIDLASTLKGATVCVAGDTSRQRLNQALVVAQVALSLALLVGAGLFVRTLVKLRGTDAGFNRENVVMIVRTRFCPASRRRPRRRAEQRAISASGWPIPSCWVNLQGGRVIVEGYVVSPAKL